VVTGRGGSVAAAPTSGKSTGVKTRVFVAADVDLYAECLALALGARRDVTVVGTAPCRRDAARLVEESGADVLIVDVTCPEALRLIGDLVAYGSAPSVIAVAAPETESEIVACIEAGVSAFVPADASFADLLATLSRVGRGESVVSPRIATTLIRRVRELADAHAADSSQALTQRELEILALIDRGLSNKEIASALSIEVSTVKNHVHHILGKLDVSRRGEAPAKLWPASGAGTRSLATRGSRSS
jgi:two-component system nitrate/nitrite response regulator NarL